MDIEKAKKIIEKGIKPEYERLRQYEGYKYTGSWLEAIEILLNELDNKDKIINKMAERIYYLQDEKLLAGYSKQEVIDYFTKKVSEK